MIALGLIAFALALWRPALALGLIAAALPVYQVRFEGFGVPTTLLELGLYAAALGTALRLAGARRFGASVRDSWRALGAYRWGLGLLVLSGALATAFSPALRASAGAFKAWYLDAALLALLLAYCRRAVAPWLIVGLAAGTSTISAWGLWEFAFRRGSLEDGRLNSVFETANYHALLTVPVLVLLVALAFSLPRWRPWLAAVAILNATALVLTFSFGGYLGLFAGLAVVALARLTRRQRLSALGVLALLGLALLGSQVRTEKFQRLAVLEGRSALAVRLEIWRTTAVIIREHPLVGVGPGAYEPIYRATVPRVVFPPLEWLVALPHSLPLAVLSLTGLLGLLAFAVLLAQFFRRVRRAPSWLRVGVAAAMVALLAHGLVDTPYFKNDLALLFVTLLGLPLLTERDR